MTFYNLWVGVQVQTYILTRALQNGNAVYAIYAEYAIYPVL